jgi:23S rRNA (cytidine1920-2'-O)/16S rRNA (cytidine1409-2'-O)-methyltransferase
MPPRLRADRLLVERGLFESRAKAQAAIAAGLVTADDAPVRKPSDEIAVDAALRAEPAFAWVSRGGVKLAAALDRFGIDVAGRVCLDVGASTGGFSDVLLARGARRVYAVDVGSGQLHSSLRGRDGLVSFEQSDIRKLDPSLLPEQPDFAAVDVSFISLKLVLPAIGKLLKPRAQLLALIKPQFEAGRRDSKKGIVRDEAVHRAVCADIAAFLLAQDWRSGEAVPSALPGGDGNREFFIEATRG